MLSQLLRSIAAGTRDDPSRKPESVDVGLSGCSHDLVLGKAAMGIGIHAVATTGRDILDVAQAERATAILIALELRNGGLRSVGIVEANHTAAARPAARLVLDFGLFDFADGGEELDQVLVARGPRELGNS